MHLKQLRIEKASGEIIQDIHFRIGLNLIIDNTPSENLTDTSQMFPMNFMENGMLLNLMKKKLKEDVSTKYASTVFNFKQLLFLGKLKYYVFLLNKFLWKFIFQNRCDKLNAFQNHMAFYHSYH